MRQIDKYKIEEQNAIFDLNSKFIYCKFQRTNDTRTNMSVNYNLQYLCLPCNIEINISDNNNK